MVMVNDSDGDSNNVTDDNDSNNNDDDDDNNNNNNNSGRGFVLTYNLTSTINYHLKVC